MQRDLIAVTEKLGDAGRMQIGAVQGSFMTMLVRLLRPQLAVEVGTFTGYSALAVARGLPPGGRLLCCDVSEEWTATAREYWDRAGVADRIDLRIAPALETLRALPAYPAVGFAFIDADKANYINYYEELLPRLSPQGRHPGGQRALGRRCGRPRSGRRHHRVAARLQRPRRGRSSLAGGDAARRRRADGHHAALIRPHSIGGT